MTELSLQSLTIPADWHIAYHPFFAIDPDKTADASTGLWWYFTEDMLQLTHVPYGLRIDLGWYPAHQPEGAFRLVLIAYSGDTPTMTMAWENPLATYRTQLRQAIVHTLEQWVRTLPLPTSNDV